MCYDIMMMFSTTFVVMRIKEDSVLYLNSVQGSHGIFAY